MRLTTALALCVSVSVSLCLGQTNRISVSGYPAPRVVTLSLDDAIRIAVERNLSLQIERFNPAILAYDVRAAQGAYYDPQFSGQWVRYERTSEGRYEEVIGRQSPPTELETDETQLSLSGNLPTGMRYEVYGNLRENNSKTARQTSFVDTNGNEVFVDFGTQESNEWYGESGVRATQPLLRNFWIDAGRRTIQERKIQRKIADLRFENSVQDIVTRTITAYYQLLGFMEAVQVAEADLKFNMQNSDEMRRRVQAGSRAAIDETKAGAEVAASRTRLVRAKNAVANAEATLKGLLSDNYINQVNATLQPTEKLMLVPVMIDYPTSMRTALEQRPDVLMARQEVERQDVVLKYTYNQLFPALDVVASWGVTGTDGKPRGVFRDLRDTRFDNESYGAILSLPLTMMTERNTHKAAKLTKEQLLLSLKSIEEGVVKEVDDAIREVLTSWELVALTRDQVAAAEADVEAQVRTMAAGRATSLEVLDAQRLLTEARNNQIQAIVSYNVALNLLVRAEGRALEERRLDIDGARRLRRTEP